MNKYARHIINQESTILEALSRLNDLSDGKSMTLLVVDDDSKMVGTVTDGDIRRAILRGLKLDCPICEFMNKQFAYLKEGSITAGQLRHIKKNGYKLITVLDGENRIVHIVDMVSNNSYLPLDAVLMAGGKGERLRPMTLTTPKPLLKVGDKPIIDYNVENLLRNGVQHINVTVNYLQEQIEEHFAAPCHNGVQVKCIREPQYLGTIGSIKFVGQWHNDTILIMNSDLFTNIDLEDFFLHFKEHDADMSIAAVPYSVSIPYGIFEIENTREITGVKEKPSFHYYANAGIYLIKQEVLETIPDGEFFNATDLMDKLISLNKKVIRFPLSGYWIDIGKPEDFKKVQDLAQHIQK